MCKLGWFVFCLSLLVSRFYAYIDIPRHVDERHNAWICCLSDALSLILDSALFSFSSSWTAACATLCSKAGGNFGTVLFTFGLAHFRFVKTWISFCAPLGFIRPFAVMDKGELYSCYTYC
jgi:hypothetical protein